MPIRKKFKNSFLLILFYALSVLYGTGTGWAQGPDATDKGLEITGLVLNETKTKPGNDFFDVFNAYFQQVEGLNYTITVSELPSRGRSSIISVKVNDTLVYQNFLNPQVEAIEEEAKRATQSSLKFLLQNLNVQKELEMY